MLAAVILATAIEVNPGETLMAHVAAIAEASVIIRKERQLVYTKQLKDGKMKEFEGRWSHEGDQQRLVRVDGKEKRNAWESSRDLDLISLMRSRFQFQMLPSVTEKETVAYCDGRPCIAVAFTPKLPSDVEKLASQTELVVSHLQGTAYIDQEHLFVIHVRGMSAEPFKKNAVTRIEEVEIAYHQTWNAALGIPVLVKAETNVQFSVFGISGNDHRVYVYGHHSFTYPSVAPPP